MKDDLEFSEEERKLIREYLDTAHVTSFSQTMWPFLFFLIPSLFLLCLFYSDGYRATGMLAYFALCLPYLVTMFSAKVKAEMFSKIICKYHARLAKEKAAPRE